MSIDHRSGSGVAASNPSERGEVQGVRLTLLLFGVWNCNGLNENSVIIAAEEGCDVLGLTKTHNCSVDRYLSSKHRLVGQGQIAFMLGRRAADSVIAVTFPHERLGYMCIAGRLRNLLVFCCYMPTSSDPDQQEELYLLLTHLMRGCGSDIIITLGDFNAQLGRTPPGQRDIRIGWWGVQKRDNDASKRMRQFLADSHTAVVNTFFQHLATWQNPSDVENPRLWRQIDYVTISTRWKSCMTGARSYWRPSIRKFKHKLNHAMVKVNFCYRTKCSQVGKRPKRWDLGSLWDEQTVSQFDEKLREQGVGVINMEW